MNVENILECRVEQVTNDINTINQIITYLKQQNIPTSDKKISNKYIRRNDIVYDKDSLYDYYIKFINNVLKTIRRHETDYCFTFGQVEELLRFEPNIKVTYNNRICCFEVKL